MAFTVFVPSNTNCPIAIKPATPGAPTLACTTSPFSASIKNKVGTLLKGGTKDISGNLSLSTSTYTLIKWVLKKSATVSFPKTFSLNCLQGPHQVAPQSTKIGLCSCLAFIRTVLHSGFKQSTERCCAIKIKGKHKNAIHRIIDLFIIIYFLIIESFLLVSPHNYLSSKPHKYLWNENSQ